MKLQEKCIVVMVAEQNPMRDEAIKSMLGNEVTIVRDFQDVISSDNVDAVDIILPHNLHAPAAFLSAKSGKHVIVEKVMARNIWECDRMISACDKTGVSLTVCHDNPRKWI